MSSTPPPHGTMSRYQWRAGRCRCARCRAANAWRVRDWRHRRQLEQANQTWQEPALPLEQVQA